MQPNIPTDVIAGLLPEFRRCKTYTDRLTFWGKHQLTEQLYYDAITVEREKHPADFLDTCIKCRTWQEVKQLPILTLAPFNTDEALQFVEWALQVRPGMYDAPNTAETDISEFQRKYTEEPFEHRRVEILSKYRESSHLWLKGSLHISSAASKNALDLIGVDPSQFNEFMNELVQRKPLDLTQRIGIGQVDLDWTAVDTYLFAKAKYDFAVFLEKFNLDSYQPQLTANDKKNTARTTLIEWFESTSKYTTIMGLLVERGHCMPNTHIWIDKKGGAKKLAAVLIKHLHAQGFYTDNEMPTAKEIVLIVKQTFGFEVSIDTVKKSHLNKSAQSDLSFIGPASAY